MDDPVKPVNLVALLFFGFFSFLLTLCQFSLIALSREKIEGWGENGNRPAKSLLFLVENRKQVFGFFEMAGIFASAFYFLSLSFSAFSFSLSLLDRPWRAAADTLGIFLGGTVLYILVFQYLPRRLAVNHIEKISRAAGPLMSLLFRSLGWIETFFNGASNLLARLFGREPESKKAPLSGEEIKMLVSLGEKEPLEIEKEEKEMIESVMTFGQTMVKEIMTPRIDMVCVEAVTTVSGVLDMAISHGYSKFPVYEETIDNIVGIVYLKDLYRFLREGQSATPLREMMRKPFFVPESKKVDDLLREMQRQKISMAIIVDEYGGTDGLVTIEDIVEEIVGEIEDEHDAQIPDVMPLGENSWLVDGQINLEDLNKQLNLNLPTEEFETLSGYLYGLMGKVPMVGDKVETDSVVLEVMVVHRQRISKVKLTQQAPKEPEQIKEELS